MSVPPSIDPASVLEEQLAQASPDLLRELLQTERLLRKFFTGPCPVPGHPDHQQAQIGVSQ